MFYKVGEWKDYDFIYDSSDSSCEMVLEDKLNKSGVVIESLKQSQISPAKLSMLYGVDIKKSYQEIKLFDIKFNSVIIDDLFHDVTVSFKLCIINKYSIRDDWYKSFVSRMHEEYGYIDDIVVMLCAHLKFCEQLKYPVNYDVFFGTRKPVVDTFSDLTIERSGIYGTWSECIKAIFIPLQMLVYIMELNKRSNYNGLRQSFGGALDADNLLDVLIIRSVGVDTSHVKELVIKGD